MVKKTQHKTDKYPLSRTNKEDINELLYQILLYANQSKPGVDFAIDLTALLISLFKCDALELWYISKNQCVRWRRIEEPNRLSRLSDLPADNFLSLAPKEIRIIDDFLSPDLYNYNKTVQDLSSEIKEYYRSGIWSPLKIEDKVSGTLFLIFKDQKAFTDKYLSEVENISRIITVVLDYHKTALEQRERVKELSCLYNIGKIISQTELDSSTMLKQIVTLLPPAWQYPEITSSIITIDSQSYSTFKKEKICHSMKSDITIDGKKRGTVEIRYHQYKPELDEGPFLEEERELLNLIADEISRLLKQEEIRINSFHLQEKLRHADRLATVGQLAAGVAHELNEPLGGILGLAQIAKKIPNIPSQLRKDLEKIESLSLYSREVIRRLLQYTRQSTKNEKLIDLNQIIRDDLFFLKARCSKMGIELLLDLEPNLPGVVADSTQLNQILTNLIVNSLQAMPDGGILTIETRFDDKNILLNIIDTGIGIPEDAMKKIFDPFFTTKDVKAGTGLGLPVVKDIITAYGGTINFISKVNHGTRCEIKLPVST